MTNETEYLRNLCNDMAGTITKIMNEPLQEYLDELRTDINRFFTDSNCLGVLYTPNTDKMFFGTYIFPKVSGDDVVDILFNNTPYLVKEYWVELDSKLFTGFMMMSPEEITALLLHDIAHMVNNSSPASVVKREIDDYLAKNNTVLKISDSVHYRGLLAYGFADAMRKYTSIFEEDHYVEDDIVDEFLNILGLTDIIREAFYKINQSWANYNREVRNKFITMSWVLRIYKDIRHNRIPALEGIKRCIELSPSVIEQRELKNMGLRISRIDDESLLEAGQIADVEDQKLIKSIREHVTDKPIHLYSQITILESIEDDIDRMSFEQTSSTDANLLTGLVSNANRKMSCIQDIVDNNPHMSDIEFKQWDNAFQKLDKIRQDITNGMLYSEGKRLINTYNKYGYQ